MGAVRDMGEPTRQRPRSQMVEAVRRRGPASLPGGTGATSGFRPGVRGAPAAVERAGEAVGP